MGWCCTTAIQLLSIAILLLYIGIGPLVTLDFLCRFARCAALLLKNTNKGRGRRTYENTTNAKKINVITTCPSTFVQLRVLAPRRPAGRLCGDEDTKDEAVVLMPINERRFPGVITACKDLEPLHHGVDPCRIGLVDKSMV